MTTTALPRLHGEGPSDSTAVSSCTSSTATNSTSRAPRGCLPDLPRRRSRPSASYRTNPASNQQNHMHHGCQPEGDLARLCLAQVPPPPRRPDPAKRPPAAVTITSTQPASCSPPRQPPWQPSVAAPRTTPRSGQGRSPHGDPASREGESAPPPPMPGGLRPPARPGGGEGRDGERVAVRQRRLGFPPLPPVGAPEEVS